MVWTVMKQVMGQFNKLWAVRSTETCDGNPFSAAAHWVTDACDLQMTNPGWKGSQNNGK